MNASEEFDRWAEEGKDRGMADRHWHTAKHALARMPVERGDVVLDLGTGSGYALRALHETRGIDLGIGLDASAEMVRNAESYTDTADIGYLRGNFSSLPFATSSIDHIWTMEAFYYSRDTEETLTEVKRILRPGGTFYCAVNFFEESEHTHHWQEMVDVEMVLWNAATYREAFREAGLSVAEQDTIPDTEIDIPPEDAFPTEEWETRAAMVDRHRTWGTLLTVGVATE